MAEYQRGGELSHDEMLSISSTQQGSSKKSKIQAKKLILRYEAFVGGDIGQIEQWLQSQFDDQDLKVAKTSWTQNKQMFLVLLSGRKKMTINKWRTQLCRNQSQPRIIVYQSTLYQAFMNDYSFHWPERYSQKLGKLIKKSITIEKFIEENIIQIKNLSKLNENIEFYQNMKTEKALQNMRFEKKRGIWLFGPANSGKTTMAIKYLENQPVYFKDMTTQTFDHYKGEPNIFLDEINRGNSKRLLPILKNLVNCIAGRFNVKFGTRMIYPKNVIVTTQYQLNDLTSDGALIDAIKERFHFYHVQRFEDYTKATLFINTPKDSEHSMELIFDQETQKIMTSLEYFKYQMAKFDQIQLQKIENQ